MAHDRNPYYDSARDKPDRSEFASLRMDIQTRRAPPAGNGFRNVLVAVIALVVIAVIAKHYLFS